MFLARQLTIMAVVTSRGNQSAGLRPDPALITHSGILMAEHASHLFPQGNDLYAVTEIT